MIALFRVFLVVFTSFLTGTLPSDCSGIKNGNLWLIPVEKVAKYHENALKKWRSTVQSF
jgi:hypothetical protein